MTVLWVILDCNRVPACTSFYLDHMTSPVHGANLDWTDGTGIIVINQRGVSKRAVSGSQTAAEAAKWISRFGSVSFNMYGCDWSWGGMNEAGLCASTMLLDETRYPEPDERPSLFLGQWLQYQLDNCASVEEVLSSDAKVRIRPTGQNLKAHYFFSDRSGNYATVEFLSGKMVAYTRASMPVSALVNERYELSVSVWEKFKNIVGKSSRFNGDLSYMRFLRIAGGVTQWSPREQTGTVDAAFSMLNEVAYKWHRNMYTQWRIVFDSQNRKIYYRTKNEMRIRQIDLNEFDFSCTLPIRYRDVDAFAGTAGMEGFMPLTVEVNREMNKKTFQLNPVDPSSGSRLDRLSQYPDSFSCQ